MSEHPLAYACGTPRLHSPPHQDMPDPLSTWVGNLGGVPCEPRLGPRNTESHSSDIGGPAPRVWRSEGAEGGWPALLGGLQRA